MGKDTSCTHLARQTKKKADQVMFNLLRFCEIWECWCEVYHHCFAAPLCRTTFFLPLGVISLVLEVLKCSNLAS